jgi:hypothetical protein
VPLYRGITGLEMNFVGKRNYLFFPWVGIFKYMGGEPLIDLEE